MTTSSKEVQGSNEQGTVQNSLSIQTKGWIQFLGFYNITTDPFSKEETDKLGLLAQQ